MLFEVSAVDPATLAIDAGALAAVALVGGYVPARRALRVDQVGAGEVQPSKMLDPGLIYDSGDADWLGYLEGSGVNTGTGCDNGRGGAGKGAHLQAAQRIDLIARGFVARIQFENVLELLDSFGLPMHGEIQIAEFAAQVHV